MSRFFAILLALLLPLATEGLAADSGKMDCASQPVWVTTAHGDYCRAQHTASESEDAPALTKRTRAGGLWSLWRRGGDKKEHFKPAVPITPLLPNGPPDLSADFRLDQRLAAVAARKMGRLENSEIMDPEISELKDVGNDVFHRLIRAGFGQQYPWKLTLVNGAARNAFSTPYGQVYVCRGLLNDIGNNPGLWAAVLAHEVAHSGLRHGVRDYLFRLRMHSTTATYGAGSFPAGYGANYRSGRWRGYGRTSSDAVRRMRLSLEIRADQVGMLIMARAGYHPDYLFALHQLLAEQHGEPARPAASLSDHPTWEVEEPQIEGQYADAIAEFYKYWPNAARSPGGLPPTVVSFGATSASKDETTHATIVSVPVRCRNSAKPIRFEVSFHQAVGPALNSFADRGMNLTTIAPCADQAADVQVKVRIPAEVATSEGGEAVVVAAYAGNDQFLGASREFTVNRAK